jgi:hypothetical protein
LAIEAMRSRRHRVDQHQLRCLPLPGTRYYGATKRGRYVSEAEAIAAGIGRVRTAVLMNASSTALSSFASPAAT